MKIKVCECEGRKVQKSIYMKWLSVGNCRADNGESGGIAHGSTSLKVCDEKII
jgi:hypothetical protein